MRKNVKGTLKSVTDWNWKDLKINKKEDTKEGKLWCSVD